MEQYNQQSNKSKQEQYSKVDGYILYDIICIQPLFVEILPHLNKHTKTQQHIQI
jgi:hypothetical protein